MKYTILPQINSPRDVKALSREQLPQLCEELRQYIIQIVDRVGGHLAPTLGAIELTVALHYLYDTPADKLVWDVGHQAYAHKVLTGRREGLKTIRQLNGLAPFCHREESEYDAFGAGHASTAISAALGMVAAREVQRKNYRVAAIVGDGALTGGLAYEGLNNVGTMRKQLTIILNDNEMSISPNVGAIHHYLAKIITNPLYNKIRDEMWNLTGKLPSGSRQVRYVVRKMEEGLKNFLTPGILFDELGIRYFGPIKGHDVHELIDTLDAIKDIRTPVLIHVLTEKGKGYPNVESSPVRFHSVKGKAAKQSAANALPNYSNVFGETLIRMAEEDERIVAITPAMREGSGLVEYSEKFADRYFDVGIAEGHAVTFAGGLAAEGMKPVCAIYSTFMQRAYDHLIHDVALQKLPVIFCLDRAGVVGGDGATHQGAFDLSYLLHVPNMVISAPKDGNELRDLMYTAKQYNGGPFTLRYPKESCVAYDPDAEPNILDIGSWEVINPGEEVMVLAVGATVHRAQMAIEVLSREGYNAGLVNMRFIKPLDTEMLRTIVKQYSHLVTLEENSQIGGAGNYILQYIQENYPGTVRMTNLALPDKFIEHGSRSEVLDRVGLSTGHITDKLRRIAEYAQHTTAEVS